MTTISYKLIRKPGHPNACANGLPQNMPQYLYADMETPQQTESNLQMNTPPLVVGQRANKIGGSFQATGIVVAAFKTTEGALRYVFEFDTSKDIPKGMLHIYGPSQLEGAVERRGLE